jgi:hypothetical protein
MKQARSTFDDHTPALGDVMVVGLENHLIVYHGADQLGALRGAKQDRSAPNYVVHREDLGLAANARD